MHPRPRPSNLPALVKRSAPQEDSMADSYTTPLRAASPPPLHSASVPRAGCSPTETTPGVESSSKRPYQRPWISPVGLRQAVQHYTSGGEEADQRSSSPAPLGGAAARMSPVPPPGKDSTFRSTARDTTNSPDVSPSRTRRQEREEQLKNIETTLLQRGGRNAALHSRTGVIHTAIKSITTVIPDLGNIMDSIQRYIKDVEDRLSEVERNKEAEMLTQEKLLHHQYETFFEGKIREILKSRMSLETEAQKLREEVLHLREDRDGVLAQTKAELVKKLGECERKEDEFADFRRLIASVYQTNQRLNLRIEDLENLLSRHRIEFPPASEDMMAYKQSSDGATATPKPRGSGAEASSVDRDGIRHLNTQVTAEFVRASKKEMVESRLTLQGELIHSAFDTRTAYRLEATGLKTENAELKFNVATLEEKVRALHEYIHEKRFLPITDTDGNEVVPLTPRPRGVPLALQTELGIDVRHSTADILVELSTVAINMKHQLHSALLKVRQLEGGAQWMEAAPLLLPPSLRGRVSSAPSEMDVGVIPTFGVSLWPTIPHFLRTAISPEVSDMGWTEAETGCLLYSFFTQYRQLRAACRYTRDSKMLAPRTYQLYEHREIVLVRLDATKEEVESSEEDVPFGYVVSYFIHVFLAQLGMQMSEELPNLFLPGTVCTTFHQRSEERVTEMESTRFAYNWWASIQRYQRSQPLCKLFLNIVDGRLPVEVFDEMESCLRRVRKLLVSVDSDNTKHFSYSKLALSMVRATADLDGDVTRCAVAAVARTFEANQTPYQGGFLSLQALTADERCCYYEPPLEKDAGRFPSTMPVTLTRVIAVRDRISSMIDQSKLPPRVVLSSAVPLPTGTQLPQPLGAAVFLRYWRHLVLHSYEKLFGEVERLLAPLVLESEVVLGLYMLPVPEALSRAAEMVNKSEEEDGEKATRCAVRPRTSSLVQFADAMQMTSEAAQMLGVPGIAKSYVALLQSRQGAQKEKVVARSSTIEEVVRDALGRIPHFNRSTHFPFASAQVEAAKEDAANADGVAAAEKEEKVEATPAPAPSSTTTKGKKTAVVKFVEKKKPKKNPKATIKTETVEQPFTVERPAVPPVLRLASDGELVEWYSFCFAMRMHLPALDGHLLQREVEVAPVADVAEDGEKPPSRVHSANSDQPPKEVTTNEAATPKGAVNKN